MTRVRTIPAGLRAALLAAAAAGVLALLLAAVLVQVARSVLAPQAGEWSVPLRWGPWTVRAGVPTVLRLATAPWAGPLLDGRTVRTEAGPVRLQWQAATGTLVLRCAPCRLQAAALGDEAWRLPALEVQVRRQGEQLAGALAAGAVHASWQGRLTRDGLALQLALPPTPIVDGYALFAPHIPELAQARIAGRFALDAQVRLPHGQPVLRPRVEGFAVQGLDAGRFLGATSACGRGSRLGADSWIARAVVAAEDQRFFEHPGYDLTELVAALAGPGAAPRGASTLSQQVAKLLVTGDERSAVRKLRELLWAVAMEEALGKPRILALYLAHAPWGEGVCGAEAAARHWFGVRAHQLTPAQAAWLAAMLHAPDREAQQWRQRLQIDVARAQWVAAGLRPLAPAARRAVQEELAQQAWVPAR